MGTTVEQSGGQPLLKLGYSEINLRASKGKFKACINIDNVFYQIGEETERLLTAFTYCIHYKKSVQIFNDKGEEQIRFGLLVNKEIDPDEDEDWHRNEIPPASWENIS